MRITENYFIVFVLISFNYFIIQINSNELIEPTTVSAIDSEDDKWYWNKEEYPNPYDQPPYCRRTKPSYVCDPDQILSRKDANRLDELIKGLKNVSTCYCPYCPPNDHGLSVGIALIKNIFKEYNVKQLENAEMFANFIRKKWNFGICDNNMILLVVTSDNQVAYSVGTTTGKMFSQFLLEDIIINNKIHFIEENYYKGLENIIKAYETLLKRKGIQNSPVFDANNEEKMEEKAEEEDSSHIGLIVGLILGFVIFVGVIVFILIYLKQRFSEDGTKFQFKGMLSRGYWLNNNERLRPVSVNPISTVGGVYEPCSIEEANDNDKDSDVDKRLREKLRQISDGSGSSDEEEIEVIDQNNPDHRTKSVNNSNNSNIEPTSVSVEPSQQRGNTRPTSAPNQRESDEIV